MKDELNERAYKWIVGRYSNPAAIPEADKIIQELLLERECLRVQVIDRGNSFEKLAGRIDKAIKRVEEVQARGGGERWEDAKTLLKSDLDLILAGLKGEA